MPRHWTSIRRHDWPWTACRLYAMFLTAFCRARTTVRSASTERTPACTACLVVGPDGRRSDACSRSCWQPIVLLPLQRQQEATYETHDLLSAVGFARLGAHRRGDVAKGSGPRPGRAIAPVAHRTHRSAISGARPRPGGL